MALSLPKRKLAVLALCLLATACAKSPVNTTGTNANEPPRIASTDVVKATPQEATLARGETGDVLVPIKITHGYHINANPPTFTYLIATELEVPPAEGVSVEFITYPDALIKTFAFAEKPLAVYEGEAIVKARLKAAKSAQPGQHNLLAKLHVQACDEKVCYAPGVLDLKIPVTIK
jgi:Disulphide bond corrector protein DsbC